MGLKATLSTDEACDRRCLDIKELEVALNTDEAQDRRYEERPNDKKAQKPQRYKRCQLLTSKSPHASSQTRYSFKPRVP